MRYLTLDLIKEHLNMLYDTDDTQVWNGEDTYLTHLGNAVEDSVERYIDEKFINLETNGNLPSGLIQAMLLLLGHYYSNRETIAYGVTHEIPNTFDFLTAIYRNYAGAGTISEQSMIDSINNKLKEIQDYINIDKNKKVVGGNHITTQESGTTTTVNLNNDVIDEGEY